MTRVAALFSEQATYRLASFPACILVFANSAVDVCAAHSAVGGNLVYLPADVSLLFCIFDISHAHINSRREVGEGVLSGRASAEGPMVNQWHLQVSLGMSLT